MCEDKLRGRSLGSVTLMQRVGVLRCGTSSFNGNVPEKDS